MAERVRWQLDGWLRGTAGEHQDCEPTAGIVLLRLAAEEVHTDQGMQLGFWGGSAEGDERAARALARVQGMLGPEGVLTAVACGGRGPGERVGFVPWGDPREPGRPLDCPGPGRWPGCRACSAPRESLPLSPAAGEGRGSGSGSSRGATRASRGARSTARGQGGFPPPPPPWCPRPRWERRWPAPRGTPFGSRL